MMLPFLDSELLPADPWGRCQERLTLVLPTGIRVDLGDHDQTFVISEHGLTKGEPLMSAYRAEWQGEGDDHAKRWLRITLADGREFDARACCLSLAPGDWPQREVAKAKRKREAVAVAASPASAPAQQGLDL